MVSRTVPARKRTPSTSRSVAGSVVERASRAASAGNAFANRRASDASSWRSNRGRMGIGRLAQLDVVIRMDHRREAHGNRATFVDEGTLDVEPKSEVDLVRRDVGDAHRSKPRLEVD